MKSDHLMQFIYIGPDGRYRSKFQSASPPYCGVTDLEFSYKKPNFFSLFSAYVIRFLESALSKLAQAKFQFSS